MDLNQLDLELRKGYHNDYYYDLAKSELLLIPMLIHDFITDHRYDDGISTYVLGKFCLESPQIIYPFFDYLVKALYSKFNVYRWSVLKMLINTLECDDGSEWKQIEDKYFEMIMSDNFTDFNNSFACVNKVIERFPQYKDKIYNILHTIDERKFYCNGECVEELTSLATEMVADFFEQEREY